MPHTEQELAEFKQQFAARRGRQIILAVPVVILIIIALLLKARIDLSRYGITSDSYGPVFFVIILAAVVFSFVNWRCPACSGYLGRGLNPKFCSKCGTELR